MGNTLLASLGLLAIIASGCVAGPDWETGVPAGASDEALVTTLVFTGLDQWATGPVVAGEPVQVDYVMADVESCAPEVVMYYRSDDGEELELPLSLADDGIAITTTFVVPLGRELALRFVGDAPPEGCVGLDTEPSDYRFPIDEPGTEL